MAAPAPGSLICVTGATGFIASHVVAQLLERGYRVRGTVRNPNDAAKNEHLRQLPGAAERLTLVEADLLASNSFDDAVDGCEAVIHTATPVKFGARDGENEIFKPGLEGLEKVLDSVAKTPSVTTFVLTSSMAAVAPQPEPPLKSEDHWSDGEAQKASGNWYGACKTFQERRVQERLDSGANVFRFVAICPTMVWGPLLQSNVNDTMQLLAMLAKGEGPMGIVGGKARNGCMSFVDVRDTAALHIAGMEKPEACGRYMCVVESLHWNDIASLLADLHPIPPVEPCDGEPEAPTQFDKTRMNSLGVTMRDLRTIFADGLASLKQRGAI
eukprot:TRINITY_DN43212_c0_g1_i1.p1 TRINITY_DN43212_c0_g1~~TRINITY_DN43212_c0_g1_i1.p1  ORF type:complete len:327 (+),score=51.71 TRINITY_DN43212_c0_g1_i1:111-1091(+)